ncbi:MAG: DUF6103 family protein [Clostridia bacterium]|nr:DUF6103 family protein [Clostridia bacterium]
MGLEKIVLTYDAQKLQAIKIFMPKDGQSIEEQLTEQLEKLYQKLVPPPARTYIEEITKSQNKTQSRSTKKTAE